MLVFTGLVNIGYIVATCICKENPIWSKTFSVIGDLSNKNKKIQPPPRPNMNNPGRSILEGTVDVIALIIQNTKSDAILQLISFIYKNE